MSKPRIARCKRPRALYSKSSLLTDTRFVTIKLMGKGVRDEQSKERKLLLN
jgi:hypothetical protein